MKIGNYKFKGLEKSEVACKTKTSQRLRFENENRHAKMCLKTQVIG